jgi:hypothetical protein
MFKKKLIAVFAVLVLSGVSLYSWPLAYMYSAWQAMPGSGAVAAAGEPAIAETSTVQTAGYGKSFAAVPFDAARYDEEYFYRKHSNEPIRDFRNYKVKTYYPDIQSIKIPNNEPIRDFRYYKDADPDYRIIDINSNIDKENRPYRDFRDLLSNK